MQAAVRVEQLSKRYRIRSTDRCAPYRTLREDLMRFAAAPARLLRRGVENRREDFWALRDVNLEIQPGEVVGVIGRNGAGKSTLLKILSRITKPTSGYARLRGRVASLLEVGTGFHPELTGRENIQLSGAILGMKRQEIRRRFDAIVGFAEIEQFLDTPVKHYSSGMYMRLGFAVAAHLEPEILIVDEVLAVGDARFQKKCLGKLNSAARGGATVLFVSHNMAAVSQLCRQAVWLRDGSVELYADAQQVVSRYLAVEHECVAQRQWPEIKQAPGDAMVRLLAARVLQHGRLASCVDINEASAIELEFAALRPFRNLVAGVSLYTPDGVCLLASADWRPNAGDAGRYCKRVALPPHFLAEGSVHVLVQLVFYDPDRQSVVLPQALAFDAIDSDHADSVRGPYRSAWPGLVRPRLSWCDERRPPDPVSRLAMEHP